jgi:integral membrane protein (TIGR00529 family)
MEFLASVPYIVRILASLFAILLFQKLTKRLDVAMVCGILLLGASTGHSAASIAGVSAGRVATLDTLFLAMVITGIIWLSGLMSQAGIMKDLVISLKSRLSRRAILAVLPAVVGLLPMPGGALFSCPLIDDADDAGTLPAGLKTKINYWFRHVWEFWWPLYPGFLLAVAVSKLPVWQLSALLFPLYLAAIGIGVFFLLRQTPQGEPEKTADGKHKPFLPLLLPIFTIVFVYIAILVFLPSIGAFNTYLPMLIGTAASLAVMQLQRPCPASGWKKIIFSGKWAGLVFIVILTRVYGAFIESQLPDGGMLMERVRVELNTYGIPAVILIALVPFVSGLTTGITVGYIGASFPVLLSLAAEGTGGYFSTIILGYGCGFLGMMLSPIHVCLIVTNQYFKTSLAASLTGLLKPAAAMLAAIAAYSFLWLSLG